jgi:hypothetical protein
MRSTQGVLQRGVEEGSGLPKFFAAVPYSLSLIQRPLPQARPLERRGERLLADRCSESGKEGRAMPDSRGRPLRFDGSEPSGDGAGIHAAYRHIHQAKGKTIASVRFGEDPSSGRHDHHGEYVVFEFSDGSALELITGSNAFRLVNDRPGFEASDLECNFVALFYADGKTEH